MLKPITKWAKCVHETKRIPEFISMGFRAAMTGRMGPAFLEIPTDVLFMKVEEEDVVLPRELPPDRAASTPTRRSSGKAVDVLRKAERPVIMARLRDLLERGPRRAARSSPRAAERARLPQRHGPRLAAPGAPAVLQPQPPQRADRRPTRRRPRHAAGLPPLATASASTPRRRRSRSTPTRSSSAATATSTSRSRRTPRRSSQVGDGRARRQQAATTRNGSPGCASRRTRPARRWKSG